MAIANTADISAYAQSLARAEATGNPAAGARDLLISMAKNQEQTNLATWQIYDALAEGAGFSARGLVFRIQASKHRYLTDYGAAALEVLGTYLTIRWVASAGWDGLKSLGQKLFPFIAVTAGPAAAGALTGGILGAAAWGASKLFGNDGEICRDETRHWEGLSGAQVSNMLMTVLTLGLPFSGIFTLAGQLIDSITPGTGGTGQIKAPTNTGNNLTGFNITNLGGVQVGSAAAYNPAGDLNGLLGSESSTGDRIAAGLNLYKELRKSDEDYDMEEDANGNDLLSRIARSMRISRPQLLHAIYTQQANEARREANRQASYDEARDEARDEEDGLGFGVSVT